MRDRAAPAPTFRRPEAEEANMARCDQCGNDYDKSFQVILADRTWTFDSFECAIQRAAPRCVHCACPIIGHGVETGALIYCSAHCAAQEGHDELRDRA
jgi:hypothetical protein